MKIIKIKPSKFLLRIEMTDEEAKELINEIGEYKQGIPKVDHSAVSKIFMALSDCLQDLELIPMTEGRKKGNTSYPRLENNEVEVKELK